MVYLLFPLPVFPPFHIFLAVKDIFRFTILNFFRQHSFRTQGWVFELVLDRQQSLDTHRPKKSAPPPGRNENFFPVYFFHSSKTEGSFCVPPGDGSCVPNEWPSPPHIMSSLSYKGISVSGKQAPKIER